MSIDYLISRREAVKGMIAECEAQGNHDAAQRLRHEVLTLTNEIYAWRARHGIWH